MTRTFDVVRRLVLVVAALNLLLVIMLGVTWLLTADDETPEVAVDRNETGDVQQTTTTLDIQSPTTSAEVVSTSTEPVDDTTPAPTDPPPLPAPYEPQPNEVQADAKRLGADVVYQLTNYQPDSSTSDLAAKVTADPARADELAAVAEDAHHPGMWSRGTIEYAQLGGHLGGEISIMVVVHQVLGGEGTGTPERAETRTMDVRLARNASGVWEFNGLASAGGRPVPRPADISALAASVVDNPRIELPDSAIWDIYSGHTDEPLLQMMSDLAEQTTYSVIVLHTGHPHNVFGTDRLSNHTVGRAVDIHELGSELVIDSHDVTSSIHAISEWLVSLPNVKEFGSPWRFDNAVAHNFTNEVHHDHIHIGVYPTSPPSQDVP